MKLLIVCDYFYPAFKSGGPIRTIVNLIESIKNEVEIRVYTKDRERNDSVPYEIVKGSDWQKYDINTLVKYVDFSKSTLFSTKKDLNERFDVIYLNSYFSRLNLFVLLLVKIKAIKTKKIILAPRGELLPEALRIKKNQKGIMLFLYKTFSIEKNIVFHATSKKEFDAIRHFFPVNEIETIPNIGKAFQHELRNHIKEKNTLSIIIIGRVSAIKNIEYSIDLISRMKNTENVKLDIYGLINELKYYDFLIGKIKELGLESNVNFKGPVNPYDLEILLKEYDLFLSNTLSENYGHAIVEAISNSIPTLISNRTPWLNLADEKVGAEYDLNDKEKFVDFLNEIYKIGDKEYREKFNGFKKYHSKYIDSSVIKDKYIELFS